jgi:dTDP-glucose pyrophosphorylase
MGDYPMGDIRKLVVSTDSTILDAIRRLEETHQQIALVVDAEGRLQGTVTDGDIRRGILREAALTDPVGRVMNATPLTARLGDSPEALLAMMHSRGIHQLPLVDADGRLAGLETVDDLIAHPKRDNWVVLMAGGLGTRLRPLTEDTPKPLLRIGAKPLLETILENCIAAGFHQFFLSVNYLANQVQAYFGDGSRWNVTIKYIKEREFLGTAGSLALLPEAPALPVLVMNGDVLTKLNFRHLMDFHAQSGALATMCVRDHSIQVPYGVVNVECERIVSLEEKPVRRFLVNAGIYVLDPEAIGYIPEGRQYDMPELLTHCTVLERGVTAFPLREYWLDIGQHGDFERARRDFDEFFA